MQSLDMASQDRKLSLGRMWFGVVIVIALR